MLPVIACRIVLVLASMKAPIMGDLVQPPGPLGSPLLLYTPAANRWFDEARKATSGARPVAGGA